MAQVQQETYLSVSPIQSPSEIPNDPYDNDILIENTRRNSLQAQDLLPDAIKQTIVTKPDETPTSCRRCSGDGIVAKPCRFCNATGKVRKRSSCIDCQAEKNGCGNTNCKSCFGVGRVMASNNCETCDGSGKGLSLTCGDCGGCGHGSPATNSARSSVDSKCESIQEES